MRNKKAWIEIVEAFVAILLIAGVLLIVINRYSPGKQDFSERVYNAEISIIREVQVNSSLRNKIVDVFDDFNATITWENANFPADIKELITLRTPNYLECTGYLCEVNSTCYLESYSDKDTYAQAGIISATGQSYNPAQLKIFCWQK